MGIVKLKFEEEVKIVSVNQWKKNNVDVVLEVSRRRFAKAVRDLLVASIRERFPDTYVEGVVRSNRIDLTLMFAPPSAGNVSFWRKLLSQPI